VVDRGDGNRKDECQFGTQTGMVFAVVIFGPRAVDRYRNTYFRNTYFCPASNDSLRTLADVTFSLMYFFVVDSLKS